MSTSEHPSLGRDAGRDGVETVFLIRCNGSVWEVTRDGKFYGDYLNQAHAQASASCAVAAILDSGGVASAFVIPPAGDGDTTDTPIGTAGCPGPSRYPL